MNVMYTNMSGFLLSSTPSSSSGQWSGCAGSELCLCTAAVDSARALPAHARGPRRDAERDGPGGGCYIDQCYILNAILKCYKVLLLHTKTFIHT